MGLKQRTAGNADKSAVVIGTVASAAFGDICPNAVGGPNQLLANGVPGENVPRQNRIPDRICKLLSQLVDRQVLKSNKCRDYIPPKQDPKHQKQNTKNYLF